MQQHENETHESVKTTARACECGANDFLLTEKTFWTNCELQEDGTLSCRGSTDQETIRLECNECGKERIADMPIDFN